MTLQLRCPTVWWVGFSYKAVHTWKIGFKIPQKILCVRKLGIVPISLALCPKDFPTNPSFHSIPHLQVDDLRLAITTDLPPRKYYFHMSVQILIICILLVLSGLFSGLNL